MRKKVNLLFPMEILNRELDFRLFQAVKSAREDARIFIGQYDAIYRAAETMRNGLYVGKNIRPSREKQSDASMKMHNRLDTLRERGFRLMHLDEEGAVMAGEEDRWKQWLLRRLDVCSLDANEFACTWGDYQRDFYRSLNPPCRDNIQTTGHPRFDLYKPKNRAFYNADVQRLKNTYGDYVLINTNFSFVNNRNGSRVSFSSRFFYGDPAEGSARLDHIHHWAHTSRTLINFVKLVMRLSIEMPHLNFVIRPHPSENVNYYKSIFEASKNVYVVHEGSVGPWLLAGKALIHDGCTTAIESHFCDVPVINYKSERDERYDLMLPNLFGVRCTSEDEVLAALQNILNAPQTSTQTSSVVQGSAADTQGGVNDVARSLIDNFEHDAFEKLTNAIWSAAENIPPSDAPSLGLGVQATYQRWREGIRSRGPRHDNVSGKLDKFAGFSEATTGPKMRAVQEILNKDVRYTIHSKRLMSVEC
jgi:surface carbohydrate biosynthesis protein